MRAAYSLALCLALTSATPIARAAEDPAASEAGAALTWTIEGDAEQRAKGRVQLNLTRRTATSRWSHGDIRPIAELQGITFEQLASEPGGPVGFRLGREAGTIECRGVARRYHGTGDCRFLANADFAAALARQGYGQASERQLFSLAFYGIGQAWLDELRRQGYERPDVAALAKAADHGVDLDYLKGMGGHGYRVGSLSALVEMRDHGVTPDYVSKLARLGIRDLSSEEVVRLRDHGVTPDYVAAFRTQGYANVPTEQLIRLRDHGVSAEFVAELRASGYRSLSTDEIIRLRDHGVSGSYVAELAGLGYSSLTAEEITRLRIHGVSADSIRKANAGGTRRSAAELVALRIGGWSER